MHNADELLLSDGHCMPVGGHWRVFRLAHCGFWEAGSQKPRTYLIESAPPSGRSIVGAAGPKRTTANSRPCFSWLIILVSIRLQSAYTSVRQ